MSPSIALSIRVPIDASHSPVEIYISMGQIQVFSYPTTKAPPKPGNIS
jgi:hypothetical protein